MKILNFWNNNWEKKTNQKIASVIFGVFIMILKFLKIIAITLFLIVIGGVFVLISTMLGKRELILLVTMLLLASWIHVFQKEKILSTANDFPLVGDANKILKNLKEHYEEEPPRNIFYYIFYPISSVCTFFSPVTKREMAKYFTFIHWILLICVIEGIFTSYQLYDTFGFDFALKWTFVEVLLIYFLCNFFSIPVLEIGRAHV